MRTNEEDNKENQGYILQIEIIEQELMLLLNETKSVSKQFNELGNQIQSYSSNIGKASAEFSKSLGKELKNISKSTGNKKYAFTGELAESCSDLVGGGVEFAVDLAGDIVKGIGSLWQQHKQNKINKKILIAKQEIAYSKIDMVKHECEKVCYFAEKISKLHAKADLIVTLDDNQLKNKIDLFRSTFYLYVKTMYLKNALEYVLAEYSAWIEGDQTCGKETPTINRTVSKLVTIYINDLKDYYNNTQRDILINLCQLDQNQEINLSHLVFFTDPYVFASYINCNVGSNDSSVSSALIKIYNKNRYSSRDNRNGLYSTQISPGIKKILETNSYYNDCNALIQSKKFMLPKYPIYNLFDILLDISFLFGVYYCGKLCWLNYSGWGFTGLILLLILGVIIIQVIIRECPLPFTYCGRVDKYYSIVRLSIDDQRRIKQKYAFGIIK